MCGIVGVYLNNKQLEVSKIGLERAVSLIHHRGPDANGIKIINNHVGFGHVRLSIIDLSEESNQPFDYENLTITFNGEIFNYIELREELIQKGYQFRTKSDTEVVLAAYLEWGESCVNKFNGMWAFAIYDTKNDILFCSRDRFGIKPFNYAYTDEQFIFASEIKAIIAYDKAYNKINYNSISRYCKETVGAQAEETWFENIIRLKPAHNLTIINNTLEIKRYWDYPKQEKALKSKEEVEKEYLRLLKDSVKLRFRSDVTVGLTLSGGLDSSAIAFLAAKHESEQLNAYTASFPDQPFNEYNIAKGICSELGINSIEVLPDYKDYVSKIKQLVYHLEAGHGSPAIFPLDAVSERAKKDITVYLEGQGADELLGGYYESVIINYWLSLIANFKWKEAIAIVKSLYARKKLKLTISLYFRQTLSPFFREIYRRGSNLEKIYTGKLKEHKPFQFQLGKNFKGQTNLTKILLMQHQTGLVNLLHYGDAISMKHSLENRLPFMDFRLVEFVFKLQDKFKVNESFGKVIHRNVFNEILPKKIINEKDKLGFVSPLKQIFMDDQFGANAILLSQKLEDRKIFKKSEIERLISEHKSGKINHERILFKILNVEFWFQNFID
jgi:asparagine synthase (glutamine-hydrolysing)